MDILADTHILYWLFNEDPKLSKNALKQLTNKEGEPEHNDPFDNALLAQAKADNLLLLTHDSKFLVFDEPYYSIV